MNSFVEFMILIQLRVSPVERRWTGHRSVTGTLQQDFHFESGVDRVDRAVMQETDFLYVSI